MAEWQSAEALARGRGKPQGIKGGGDNELDVRGAGTADGFRRLADDGVPRMAENKAVKGGDANEHQGQAAHHGANADGRIRRRLRNLQDFDGRTALKGR